MASLKVYKDNQIVRELSLSIQRAYLIGRGSGCDIQLDSEPGISREHLRLYCDDGIWKLDVLSRYGLLYVEGTKQNSLELGEHGQFEVPPYRFVFENRVSVEQSAPMQAAFDKTSVGMITSVALLKLFDNKGLPRQVYKLEGDSWVAGRDTAANLFVDNPKFSRRQFEIKKQDSIYFIRDLGSSNGTMVNGQQIASDQWTILNSSDVISVLDLTLHFELRDSQFEKRIGELGPVLQSALAIDYPVPMPEGQDYMQAPQPFTVQRPPPSVQNFVARARGFFYPNGKLNVVRVAIAGVVVVGCFAMLSSPTPAPVNPAQPKGASPTFDKLPLEQQKYIRQTYVQAQQLYYNGNYELTKQEVLKIHKLVPRFEDSLELLKNAEEGIRLTALKNLQAAEEEDRRRSEEKIQAQVAQCRKSLNTNSDQRSIEECLAPVLSLNPEHPDIQLLKMDVERLVSERLGKEAATQEHNDAVRKLRSMFDQAEASRNKGKLREAIAEHSRVANSDLPDPNALKPRSRQLLGQLRAALGEKQKTLEKSAEAAAKAGDMKTAVFNLMAALEIDPDNSNVQEKLEDYKREHKKLMQNVYQEGILEESIGEVEVAKAKWRKILAQSYKGEEYFEKATIKLRKYGGE